MSTSEPRVADAIARTMYAHGVRHAFGIPGNDVLELIRACTDAGIAFTLAKSETGAAFMADAVSHVTGHPAACIFALGPGIANGASGIAGAVQERSPIIVLGGEMTGNRREIYNHQAFDHVALMRPITKYAAELNPQRAGQQTARALDIAMTHPRGPVFLNCPADATRAAATDTASAAHVAVHHAGLTFDGRTSAKQTIAGMKRPLALVGLGALHSGVARALEPFLQHWKIPFLTTYKAKGILPHSDLNLGAVGLSPVLDDLAMSLVREADGLVLIGFDPIELRDAWIDAWPASKPVVSLDHSAQTHGVFPLGVQLIGDVTEMLKHLTPERAVEMSGWPAEALSSHVSRTAQVVRPRDVTVRISPAALFSTVSRRVTADMHMTVDVGAHRILANHVIRCVTPGQLLQSNGLGHMGYAIPAAIGSWLGDAKPVIAMLGDGCALMSLGELALVAELQAPIVTIILVDDDLALIDLKQDKLKMKRQGVGFLSPDFAALARGFGLAASDVSTLAAFAAALDAAIASGKPHVIAAKVDPAEYWEQM